VKWECFQSGGVTRKPSGAGCHVIMIGIGSKTGFLSSTKCFIGQNSNKNPDDHTEINGENFISKNGSRRFLRRFQIKLLS